jgi:hypothetical protein
MLCRRRGRKAFGLREKGKGGEGRVSSTVSDQGVTAIPEIEKKRNS